MYAGERYLLSRYAALESPRYEDRNGIILAQYPNEKGAYTDYQASLPPRVAELLVQKEDRFFYLHPGINPVSIARALWHSLLGDRVGGASTITQQLVKNLLGNELHRTLGNKIIETLLALDLEVFASKQEILIMYANTVFMANQVQGLSGASQLYFRRPLSELDDTKLAMLLATISSPAVQNPWREENATASRNLALRLGVAFDPEQAIVTDEHVYQPPRLLELDSLGLGCTHICKTTLDANLTDRVRDMLRTNVERGWDAGAKSGAVVVIKLPENELLAIVGTPDQTSTEDGQQINMALQPRAIGSTAKPFIYLQGYAKGLRPYTQVDDRELKFPIGTGFPLYPKNYDGRYRGWITLHSALSNSLNIPTVLVLRYVGLPEFYGFLENGLGLIPLRDLDEYQYGIALGALEVDPLTLAHLFTIFPENGMLKPLVALKSGSTTPFIATPMSRLSPGRSVASPALAHLVTRVLNDRLTGVDQFGLVSSLNLPRSNYAVKTGTSQDYHDSWTVGYTPDYLVAVWYGNPDNTPLRHITGQTGAGTIWHDTMQLLMNSPYDHKTPFDFSGTREFAIDGSVDVGLEDDTVSEHRDLLPNDALIVSPQDGDTYLSEARTAIPLISDLSVDWHANGVFIGHGSRVVFYPQEPGDYTIEARDSSGHPARITVHVVERE